MVLEAVNDTGVFRQQMQVMGSHHDGRTRCANRFQKLYNLAAGLRIQISCGFIGKNDFRTIQDGTGDNDTLLFTS